MNLNQIKARPFPEGIIRVASSTDPESGKTTFNGTIEVLARHHAPVSEENNTPTLADHPIAVLIAEGHSANKEAGKVVEVPIRMFFNKAANSISAVYQAYDSDGRPVCRGDGVNAKRHVVSENNVESIAQANCPGPETCEFAKPGQATCRRQVCMTVQIMDQENPLSVFEVRTSSYNSYKALQGQLTLIESRFGGLRHVPLKLQLWQASNQASEYESFDVFKIALDAPTEIDAMRQAATARKAEEDIGLASDTDAAYMSTAADDMGVGADDFVIVQDFYRPISAAARTGRRSGSKSVVSSVIKGGEATKGNLAGDVIAQAMAVAGSGKSAAVEEM